MSAMQENKHAFRRLPLSALKDGTGFERPFFNSTNPVKLASYALEVMTDLRFVPAGTIGDGVDLEYATQRMIARGVRLMLVIDGQDQVVGLITARDLLGKRPEQVMNAEGITYDRIIVSQVMTGADDIEVLPLGGVLQARVGDIIETLKHSGRQHALVVEDEPQAGTPMVRGIFSASQIARQLGVTLNNSEVSHTFAEIDKAMGKDQPAPSRQTYSPASPAVSNLNPES